MSLAYIGSDPEVAIRHRRTGSIVSAPTVLRHFTKDKPYRGKSAEVFPDNANLEFNIPPALSREEFVENIRKGLAEAKELIGRKYELFAPASLEYPAATLDNPYCKQFGCEPDFDAWTLTMNEVVADAANSNFRTCGGHIHYGHHTGFDFLKDPYGKVDAVKAFDAVLGVSSLLIDNDPASEKRRQLYGAPGSHRPKNYGVECRSLSNFWLRHPDLVRWTYNMSMVALRSIEEGVFAKLDLSSVPTIIKTADKEQAKKFQDTIIGFYPEVAAYNYQVAGLTSAKTQYMNLEKVWGI